MKHTMQAIVGASAAPLWVPGVPVAPQGSVGQGLQGPAITAEALEDLGWGVLAQEPQGVHLPQEAQEDVGECEGRSPGNAVLRMGAACTHGGHLEGGDIESPVDEDPGDSLGARRGAERALIGDEAKGVWEQELQAQVLKKVGII